MAQWYFIKNSVQSGPHAEAQFLAMVSQGVVLPGDMVWCEGMPRWMTAGEVPNLLAGSTPPPVPRGRVAAPAAGLNYAPGPQAPLPRNKWVAALLAFFLGTIGIHDFYLGFTGRGTAKVILAATCFGMVVSTIWSIVDLIMILTDATPDAWGRPLES